MDLTYVKSLHIIFVVTWFAGLFYIVRLFIYQREAQDMEQPQKDILTQQYRLMQRRLWVGITWPSAILTMICGGWLWGSNITHYLSQPWMNLKLMFVVGLFVYQLKCHFIFLQQKNDIYKMTSFTLRLWNELATLFLFVIVFLVVVKSTSSLVWAGFGLALIAGAIYLGVYFGKKKRDVEKSKQNKPLN